MYAIGCLLFWGVLIGAVVFLAKDVSNTSRINKKLDKELDE